MNTNENQTRKEKQIENNIFALPCDLCRKMLEANKDKIFSYPFRNIDYSLCGLCNELDTNKIESRLIVISRAQRLHEISNEVNVLSFDLKDSYHKELLDKLSNVINSFSLIDSLGMADHIIKNISRNVKELNEFTKESKKHIIKQTKDFKLKGIKYPKSEEYDF